MSFTSRIQQWVAIDNQIKLHSDKIHELREEKSALGIGLKAQADECGHLGSVIQISDGKLRFVDTRVTQSLTFKYVEETLSTLITDPETVNRIVDQLKSSRGTKIVTELKRFPAPKP